MTHAVEELSHRLTQIGRVSDAVKAEFDLIGTRMTWLVISQSFMFATFATAVANVALPDRQFSTALKYLVCAIPILGATVAILVGLAIGAAHSVAIEMKNQRDDLIKQLPEYLQIKLISSRDKAHQNGNLPAALVPWLLTLAWGGAVLSLPLPPW